MSKQTNFRGLNGVGGDSNRTAISVRFNKTELKNMRALMEFWSMSAKDVIKLGFEQLVTASEQLQRTLPKAEETKDAQGTTNSVGSGATDGNSGTDSTTDSNTTGTSTPTTESVSGGSPDVGAVVA